MSANEKDSISAKMVDANLVDFDSFERALKRRKTISELELGINSFAGAASLDPSKKKQPKQNPPKK
ncbi:hypothetical protein C0J08_21095 [Marinomonas sp. CT5]|uniref:hypothetical protein n=1 Tax=Marinomonas sp. CT5 TaxID=2066133 RepID=UPI001BB055F6|nr:hypothetical protein [Marinomonas sp. CT5]QUX97752.1 hypothetical protein C0J08_21095 [Marinomonas sp. CT5]